MYMKPSASFHEPLQTIQESTEDDRVSINASEIVQEQLLIEPGRFRASSSFFPLPLH